jgi:deoxyribonuclease-2
VNSLPGALRASLAALASNCSDTGYVFYNDEDPDGTERFANAHAKGVVIFGREGGFWLTHSIPRYPGFPGDDSSWSEVQIGQTLYGQHALCLSLPRSEILKVFTNLLVARPHAWHLPELLLPLYGETVMPIITGHFERGTNTSAHSILTAEGHEWRHVVKAPAYDVQFHEDVLEPELGSGMLWETWVEGSSLPSDCPPTSQFASLNILSIRMAEANATWRTLVDHSKWGVSPGCSNASSRGSSSSSSSEGGLTEGGDERAKDETSTSAHVVCFGDLNRAATQRRRGGGCVCRSTDERMWVSFRKLVQTVEACGRDGEQMMT